MRKVSIEKFKENCLKVIEHYKTDLDIDLDTIETKTPALFFAYVCGSHSVSLYNFEQYPKKGDFTPYLFGIADRERILDQIGSTLKCESVIKAKIVHYFDGQNIYLIDHKKALEIVSDYKNSMQIKFNSGAIEHAN